MKIKGFQADHFGCGYYRMELPQRWMNRNGHEWVNRDKIEASDFTGEFPAIVMQRQYISSPLVGYFKARKEGAAILYELDDWVWNLDKSNPVSEEYSKPEVRANIERYMCLVDAAIVSVPYLGKMMERWLEPERIFVCPNALDFDVWDKHLKKRESEKLQDGIIRIGWHGSATHSIDFVHVVNPLAKILRENKKVHLVITGWDAPRWYAAFKGLESQIEYQGWSGTEEFGASLINVDIGIAPLAYTEFNRCKSAIKHYEYSALKIPTIATWIEPYMEVKSNGGITIEGYHERLWYDALKGLIQNKARRIEMGEQAYKIIQRDRNMETAYENWEIAIEAAQEIRKHRQVELWIGEENDPNRKFIEVA